MEGKLNKNILKRWRNLIKKVLRKHFKNTKTWIDYKLIKFVNRINERRNKNVQVNARGWKTYTGYAIRRLNIKVKLNNLQFIELDCLELSLIFNFFINFF